MNEKMNPSNNLQWSALSVFILAIIGLGALILLHLMGCERYVNSPNADPASVYGDLMSLFGDAAFPLLGLLILKYRPENRIGWITLLYGLVSISGGLLQTIGNCNQVVSAGFTNGNLYGWMGNIISLMILIFLGLFFLTFPNGRFLSLRWRNVSLTLAILMCIYTLFIIVIGSFSPQVSEFQRIENFVIPLFIFPFLGIISLFVRWMRSDGDERQQIKWVAFFILIVGTTFIVVEIVGTLFYPAIFEGWFYLFVAGFFILGFPVVLGLAIFKYRLYDIDIIIRRTLVYSLVTVTLILVYFSSVILLQQLFTGVSGQESPLAIVVSTLLIAALFNPIRNRIQGIIDRRFYRKKYNAQQVLAQFGQTARDETDVGKLSDELANVLKDTMQPEIVGIWLKNESS